MASDCGCYIEGTSCSVALVMVGTVLLLGLIYIGVGIWRDR